MIKMLYYIEPEPTQYTECYADYPFAYDGGKMCCQLEVENDSPGAGNEISESCNGNQLTLDSTCCKDDAFKKCPKELCINYGNL